ncbi:MAG: glycosyltransferase [Chitinophagales bacterium]|nr:glycosyltransferase [Chitinophagales bacterium]
MKLSIVLVTYNHEKYIRQCIESILNQQFNFEWELIIAYDRSTDNTLSIAEEYRDRIKNFSINVQEKNVGATRNCSSGMVRAKGELVAVIDGDDYNADSCKYVKQVAVFDSNPDVTFCFANGYRYFEDSGVTEPFYKVASHIPQKFDLEYFYHHNIPTNPTSFMFRKSCLPQPFPDFYYKYYQGDWMLVSFCGLKGNLFFLNEKLACYRIHSKSILQSTKMINALIFGKELGRDMNKYLNYKYDRFLGNDSWYNEHLVYEYLKQKEYAKAFVSTMKYLSGRNSPGLSKLRYFLATLYNIQFRQSGQK